MLQSSVCKSYTINQCWCTCHPHVIHETNTEHIHIALHVTHTCTCTSSVRSAECRGFESHLRQLSFFIFPLPQGVFLSFFLSFFLSTSQITSCTCDCPNEYVHAATHMWYMSYVLTVPSTSTMCKWFGPITCTL